MSNYINQNIYKCYIFLITIIAAEGGGSIAVNTFCLPLAHKHGDFKFEVPDCNTGKQFSLIEELISFGL